MVTAVVVVEAGVEVGPAEVVEVGAAEIQDEYWTNLAPVKTTQNWPKPLLCWAIADLEFDGSMVPLEA